MASEVKKKQADKSPDKITNGNNQDEIQEQ